MCLDNYEDWELVSELQDRGYYIGDSYENLSLRDSMNIEELTGGFRELDFEEQQLVLILVTKLREK